MALTLDDLRGLLQALRLTYFIAPDRPVIMLGVQAMNGRYQIVMPLEFNGEFLQFRVIGYLRCPADHRNLPEVLKVLGAMNYSRRLVKFGWDPSDGEIVAYADLWLVDATLTVEQFRRMLENYVSVIDQAYRRVGITIETGKDPGDQDSEGRREEPSGPVRALLEKLRGRKKQPEEPGQDPDFGSI